MQVQPATVNRSPSPVRSRTPDIAWSAASAHAPRQPVDINRSSSSGLPTPPVNPQALMSFLHRGEMPPREYRSAALGARSLSLTPEHRRLLNAYTQGAAPSSTAAQQRQLAEALDMRKFAIGFEAPSAPSTPPWAIRPTPADASQAGSAPTNVPSVTSNADQVVAAPVKTAVPIASRDVQATIRSLQTNFGFDAERLKHLAKAIRASLNGEASSIHAALAFDRTYASSIDGSILNPANRARFLVLAMAIDHLAIVAAAATSAATTASAGRLHSNVPLEVSDAVSAFNRLIGESTAAGASAHPFEMHSLPLRTEDGAARLLYRSMARVSDEAGRLNDVDKLPQMERLIPHIEGFISELRRAGHINDNDKSLLQGAASRVRAAVGLMREFPTLSPLQYPFIAGTLSLSPESRSANAEANSAEIELLIRPLMQWHKHTTLARYTRDGHLARQARLIDRAKELKLIGPAQHQMISMKVDEHTLGSVESDDGPELPIFKSTVFWWDDKAASPDSL